MDKGERKMKEEINKNKKQQFSRRFFFFLSLQLYNQHSLSPGHKKKKKKKDTIMLKIYCLYRVKGLCTYPTLKTDKTLKVFIR